VWCVGRVIEAAGLVALIRGSIGLGGRLIGLLDVLAVLGAVGITVAAWFNHSSGVDVSDACLSWLFYTVVFAIILTGSSPSWVNLSVFYIVSSLLYYYLFFFFTLHVLDLLIWVMTLVAALVEIVLLGT